MRRVIVSNVMSLDGFFEAPNKEMDRIIVDDEFFAHARDMLRSADTLLFGRTTYLHMAGYWRSAAEDEIASHMNSLAKVVSPERSTKRSGTIPGWLRRMRQRKSCG